MAPKRRSQLGDTITTYLNELGRRSEDAELVLGDTYRRAAKALDPLWRDAYTRLQEAQAAGYDAEYLSGYIWTEQRLATLLAEAERLATALLTPYGDQLNASLQDSARLAQQSVKQSVWGYLGPEGAPYAGFVEFPESQLKLLAASLSDGSPVMDAVRRYGITMPRVVRNGLVAGIANGESPTVVAHRIANELGGHYGQMHVMVRTEMFRTYRLATQTSFLANKHLVRGWRWKAALQTRTCPVCWAMHGTEHPLDEVMGTHPMCRCSMVPILRPLSEIHPALAGIPLPKAGPTGVQLFDRLPMADKVAILGPTGARAYTSGLFKLPQLVDETWSATWGPGRRQRSMSSVIGPRKLRELRQAGKPVRVAAPPKPPTSLRKPITPAPKAPVVPQASPVAMPAVRAPTDWRPNMTRAEANQWAMQGDLTRPLFHVTSPEGAVGITNDGFDLTRSQWGRVWGNGAYMSDTRASEAMYSQAFTKPTKLELRVNSRKTLHVDISGQDGWGHHTLLDTIGPQATDTYKQIQRELDLVNDALLPELPFEYVPGMGYDAMRAGNALNDVVREKARKEGRYFPDVRAEALSRTLQHYGYDAIDLVDEPHRSSVGGSQVIVFDPKRVTVVKEP